MFDLERLAQWARGTWQGCPGGAITGFSNDTRTLVAGQCFVALKSEMRDGHDFLQDACKAGASAALVSAPKPTVELPQLVVKNTLEALQAIAREYRTKLSIPVIGVTGSCGKTSTKDLLQILLGKNETLATRANLNNTLGVPLTLTAINPHLHRQAVIEAGMSVVGEMDRLGWMIQPDVAFVTLVASAHGGQVGGLEGVAQQKSILLKYLSPSGIALFPIECLRFQPFQELSCTCWAVREAAHLQPVKVPAGVRIFNYQLKRISTQDWRLNFLDSEAPQGIFKVRLVTQGQARNAALAILAAWRLGVGEQLIAKRLCGWASAEYRGELYNERQCWFYADCYNANPASMSDALEQFAHIMPESLPRLYVMGSMRELGEDAPAAHAHVAAKLCLRRQDQVVFVGEHAKDYWQGFTSAGQRAHQATVLGSTQDVKPYLAQFHRGAVFLKASKGFKFWELIPDKAQLVNLDDFVKN